MFDLLSTFPQKSEKKERKQPPTIRHLPNIVVQRARVSHYSDLLRRISSDMVEVCERVDSLKRRLQALEAKKWSCELPVNLSFQIALHLLCFSAFQIFPTRPAPAPGGGVPPLISNELALNLFLSRVLVAHFLRVQLEFLLLRFVFWKVRQTRDESVQIGDSSAVKAKRNAYTNYAGMSISVAIRTSELVWFSSLSWTFRPWKV